MLLSQRFRQGMKAAIPVWIAFVPSSIAWGIAAQAHGLSLGEIVFMSAWVYSGPAQFAVLEPLASGKSSLQVLVAGFLMNLRFLPMSASLAPYFAGAARLRLLLASHFVSASSFIIPYLQFEKERALERVQPGKGDRTVGVRNLYFFLGVGMTAFLVWVGGSAVGYGVALAVPSGFEEVLKFILPGYFAGLLVIDMRGWAMPLICLGSLLAAIPASLLDPEWGWIATAIGVAAFGWSFELWIRRGWASS
jgi:predicted branched-subunit amino acid permease